MPTLARIWRKPSWAAETSWQLQKRAANNVMRLSANSGLDGEFMGGAPEVIGSTNCVLSADIEVDA